MICLERGLRGTVLPLARAYLSYNYFSNSATAGPQPGMKKKQRKNTEIILESQFLT